MNNVNPVKAAKVVAKLLEMYAEKLEQNDRGFFNDLEAFNEKYSPNSSVESFIIGEVFRHRDPNCVWQYHGDNFAILYAKPSAKKVIPINFEAMKLAPEYVLPKSMKNAAIQKAAHSKPMREQQFSLLLYSLIIKPELGRDHLRYELSKGKDYIFHVQLDSGGVVAFCVNWSGDGWQCRALRFAYDYAWSEESVFLSLTTAKV